MSYSPFVPQPNDKFSQSQVDFLNNFTALDNTFDIDHYKFSNVTDKGKHKKITLPEVQGADPGAALLTSNIYSKDIGGVAELFFQNASRILQLTGSQQLTSNGYITLPGGFIIKWGTGSGNNAGVTNTFPVAFPNNCWSVQFMTVGTKASEGLGTITKNNFIAFTDGSVPINYIAIGN